jgi:hypothetical protein
MGERNCHERFAIEGLTAGADKDGPENFALPYNTKKQIQSPIDSNSQKTAADHTVQVAQ